MTLNEKRLLLFCDSIKVEDLNFMCKEKSEEPPLLKKTCLDVNSSANNFNIRIKEEAEAETKEKPQLIEKYHLSVQNFFRFELDRDSEPECVDFCFHFVSLLCAQQAWIYDDDDGVYSVE